MPLVTGPCKTAILQGQILAMHSSVAVGLTGIARARKMSAIREYFRFLEGLGVISKSPTTGIETPKREKNGRQVLRSDEYTKMLSLAGANPRDYAILQVFLQTGIRVSELANLTRDDIDSLNLSGFVAAYHGRDTGQNHPSWPGRPQPGLTPPIRSSRPASAP